MHCQYKIFVGSFDADLKGRIIKSYDQHGGSDNRDSFCWITAVIHSQLNNRVVSADQRADDPEFTRTNGTG